jgi:DNA-binding NtrC family response regulator/tetratricopeptide (TPR) repeat protein
MASNPTMSPPDAFNTAQQFEQEGRFIQALDVLERGPITRSDLRSAHVLRIQLLERVGKHAEARSMVASLLNSRDLVSRDRSACELVLARLDWDCAKVDSAIGLLQRSINHAKQGQDLVRTCWAQLRLLGMLRDQSGVDAASALFTELRANAIRLGEPRLLAALHIFVGQTEAQRGSFVSAHRHTRIGLELLDGAPNLWLEATAENINFGISVLLLDVDRGFEQGRNALALAEQSGAASTIGTSLGNLGNLYLATGHLDAAIDYHRRALKFVPSGGENWNGSLESLAQVSLAQGRLDECRNLLTEIDHAITCESDRQRYVYRHARITRSKLLLRLGEHSEALRTIDATLSVARELGDQLLGSTAQLMKAQILMDLGNRENALAILWALSPQLPGLPVEFHVSYERLVSQSLLPSPDHSHHIQRAERISSVVQRGGQPFYQPQERIIAWSDTLKQSLETREGERKAVQSIAALAIHKSRPELFAREIVALLESAGILLSATISKQLATGTSTVLSTLKCEPSSKADGLLKREFQLGRIDGQKLTVETTCESATEAIATLNAIAVIVDALQDLEAARLERDERATLWPIEELTSDSDGAVLGGHMRALHALARRIGSTSATVLITGESGTGKEILARAVHACSPRAAKPFVPFNCASIPREMLESQLFGHRRGAFTGADRDQPGVIRAAIDGTLFLDEIGELSLDLQPKLLRFLESGEISPLGEPNPLTVNVRVVAATNAQLETLVREGRFREDLYYRLNVFPLPILPLRERRDEIPALVNAFVSRAAAEFHKGRVAVAEDTMEHLLVYSWPGNVRQLLNEIRRMVALADPDSTLTPAQISQDIRRTLPAFPARGQDREAHIEVPLRSTLSPTLAKIEREMITAALQDSGGHLDAAAKALGISRKGLYLKRQRLGL